MRPITKLIVHCSASPDALDIGFTEINEWHKARGFLSPSGIHCGYHLIIRRNGTVEAGRMVNEIGAHVEGANSNSIGVCLVGTHEFAKEQLQTLKRVIQGLQAQFPDATIHEHREFPSAIAQHKTCPNLNVKEALT